MILIATLPIATATMIKAQTTLSAPSVQVPNSNWLFQDSTKYPNAPSEYDPAGGGMLSYVDNTNYDTVKIWYEKAQVSSYTSQQLENEAVRIFNRDDASDTRSLDSSGTKTYANVAAGFAISFLHSNEPCCYYCIIFFSHLILRALICFIILSSIGS